MSNIITNQVKLLKTGSPTAKAVLMALGDCADDNGYCYPSIDYLVLITEFSDRTIEKAIMALESCGLLSVVRAIGRHNSYQFTVEKYVEPAKELRSSASKTSEAKTQTSEANDIEPANLRTRPANLTQKPAKELRSNHITINKHHKETYKQDSIQKPDEVQNQVWIDFLKHRKTKKADLTQTALDGIIREAAKSNFTLNDALTESITRGWVGFKAEWVNKSTQDKPTLQNQGKTWDWDSCLEPKIKDVHQAAGDMPCLPMTC